MLMRLMRYAEKLGLNIDDLMQMTVLEAVLKIEDTKAMWKEVKQIG
jgi:hypothetical protein